LSLFLVCCFNFQLIPSTCALTTDWEYEDEIHRLASIPGPLFSFGQNIMREKSFMIDSYFEVQEGLEYVYSEWDPMLMYGVTEKTTLTVIFPIISERINRLSSTGAGNITLNFEHALYNHFEKDSNHQWTILASLLLPTAKKTHLAAINVNLAQPSTSFFIGTTAHHISAQWYVYAAVGALFGFPSNNTKYGTAILYDFGLSFPLRDRENSYLSIIFEANGRFRSSDVVDGIIDGLSGNNRIWIGPVFHWVYSEWTLQCGFQFPISQRFFVPQATPSYRIAFQLSFG